MADESLSPIEDKQYTSGTSTTSASKSAIESPIAEAERVAEEALVYYGLAKPRRITVRARIIHGEG